MPDLFPSITEETLTGLVDHCSLQIFASPETVCARARSRTKTTGRYVPESILLATIDQIPQSLKVLEPLADFVAEIANDSGPVLERPRVSWDEFQQIWQQQCPPNFDPEAELRMANPTTSVPVV